MEGEEEEILLFIFFVSCPILVLKNVQSHNIASAADGNIW